MEPKTPMTIPMSSIVRMFFTLLLIGIVIGVFGSTLALRRFLEV